MSKPFWQRARFEAEYEEHVYYVDGQAVGYVFREGLYEWSAETVSTDGLEWIVPDEETGKQIVEREVHNGDEPTTAEDE